ncbi:MAG: BamA/TamA family outer membrane protein [Candidatus Marinimicrobia bacterium]|nr:BamA/TamA family outer membrane protein [Candidatus Neomarinimicrobiota bacterium]
MKKLRRNGLLVFVIVMMMSVVIAQDEDKTPTGWSFGGVPAIGGNSDIGLLYGIILNPYNYGDGSVYPDYKYQIYLEVSRTTKGGGINRVQFDSKYLLPLGLRVTGELAYMTEQALPFYGFNGYEADYNPVFEISDVEHEDYDASIYKTRVYYRHERNVLKFTSDFQKKIYGDNLNGLFGVGLFNTEVGTVDISVLNEGKTEDLLPDSTKTLFDERVESGIINPDEKEGGNTNYLKFGAVYDTRDNEANPMSGMWTEGLVQVVPSFLGSDFDYSVFTFTHRQYFSIIPNDLSFAYRVGYQGVLSGDIPFFMLPYYQSSYQTQEGFGGSKTMRGIMKNRVVGNSVALFNTELRWKFLRTQVFGQNLYLALNAFVDGGQVIDKYPVSGDIDGEEALHLSYGGGFRIALNENFIVAIDYGMAADEQDGTSGLYIGLGYLY